LSIGEKRGALNAENTKKARFPIKNLASEEGDEKLEIISVTPLYLSLLQVANL
jgi:hypothetical protein